MEFYTLQLQSKNKLKKHTSVITSKTTINNSISTLLMLTSNSPLPNPYVDLKFPLTGHNIPFNHGYSLYSAISHQFPVIHDLNTLSIHPITGKPEFPHLLHLTEDSHLCLRLPINQVPLIYRLAGKTLTLNDHKIRALLEFPW